MKNLKVWKFLKNGKNILKIIKNNTKKSNLKILILGLAYKPNIDDLRESGSINLIHKLLKSNIKNIYWSDPHIKKKLVINELKYCKKGLVINHKNLKKFDVIVLMTDHDKFDYKMIYRSSKLIIDCRGRYPVDQKVIRA